MSNTSYTQSDLADSSHFQHRVQAALMSVAWQVLSEDPGTQGHAARAAYARNVIGGSVPVAQVARWLVERTNLIGATTTYDFSLRTPVTDASDAAIESQLSSDWTLMAGA